MTNKWGVLATFAAVATTAATVVVGLRRTRRLQDEARALGKHVPRGPYEAVVKRPLDAALSILALIVLSPTIAVIAIVVRVKLGTPVLFSQERIGVNEKVIVLRKFRSMTNETDENGNLLSDALRQTRFGNLLRSLSLDELPELINIVNGDMAIIGPRPLPVSYLPYFKPEERVRHEVRGGLTVPEVLSSKTYTTWDEQLSCEAEYSQNITFVTDCRIVLATLKIIPKRVGSGYGEDIRSSLSDERG